MKTSKILVLTLILIQGIFSCTVKATGTSKAVDLSAGKIHTEIAQTQNTLNPYLYRGMLKLREGNIKGAINDFNRAIKNDPNNMSAYAAKIYALQKLGDTKAVEIESAKLSRIQAKFSQTYMDSNPQIAFSSTLQEGIKKYESGDLKGAFPIFDKSFREASKNPSLQYAIPILHHYRGTVQYELGNKKAGFDDLVQAVKLESDPYKNLQSHYYIGDYYLTLGQEALAIDSFDKARAIDSYSEKYYKPEHARPYLNRAIAKYSSGDRKSAFNDIYRALKIDPKYAEAYYIRGIYYRDDGEYGKAQALSDFSKAMENTSPQQKLKPEYANLYFEYALIKSKIVGAATSLSDFDQIIKLNPNYIDAYFARAIIKQNVSGVKAALNDFDMALKLKPDYAITYTRLDIADKEKMNSYINQAIKFRDLSRAINSQVNSADAYYERGLILLKSEDTEGALDDFSQAIRINSNHTEAYYNRARIYAGIYYRNRNLTFSDKAKSDYDRAIRIKPDHALAQAGRDILLANLEYQSRPFESQSGSRGNTQSIENERRKREQQQINQQINQQQLRRQQERMINGR
jgi:tetratricopeptide (TPR) repeat protein